MRHHWSKVSVASDAEYEALRLALQGISELPLAQTLERQRQFRANTASDERLARRWADCLGFRGFGRMLASGAPKSEDPSARRNKKLAPPPIALPVVAQEIGQFLFWVG